MSLVDEIQRSNVGAAINIMNAAPHLLNQRDAAGGEFPLHMAVRRGLVDLASVMLKNGAKANCSNMHGLTPLHYAARLSNLEMISLLLQHGAYLNQVESFFWTPLHYAVYHGSEAAVNKILEAVPTNPQWANLVNETDSLMRSALHVACRQGHLSIAAKLLAHGANIAKDSSGHTPFYYLTVKEANKEHQPDFYLDVDYAASSSATLCSDMRQLYQSGLHSDLTFVVEGLPEANEDGEIPAGAVPTTKEYKAHKAIIYARAPALLKEQAPFRTLQGPNKVSIGGLTHTLFSAILEYIYSGGIEFKETDLDFVFNLAKKGKEFELDALSNFAESLILSNLSEENVVSMLEAATLFACCPRVENYCRYYIIRNYDRIAGLPGQQEELDKVSSSQFVSVLPRLSIHSETNPPITSIEKPPTDFQQNKTGQKLPIGGPAAGMPMGNVYPGAPGAAYPPAAAASLPPPPSTYTPKAAKPKKAKTPKADKLDSPRVAGGARGGLNSSSGVAMIGGGVGGAGANLPIPQNPELLQGKTLELIKKLHKDLMHQENDSAIFNAKVDWDAMGLPDYPWIIKRPMDLGTVWTNLATKRIYKTMEEWAHDVRTVWDNARTYNAPESEVYQAAERLSKLMENGYSAIKRSLEIPNYDPYHPKTQEYYFNTYTRHYEEYRAANPQIGAVTAAAIPPAGGYVDPYASMPPAAANNPVRASPAPKKTRATPPAANSPIPASAGVYNPMMPAANNNNNRTKRKSEENDEFDMMHMAHTSAPPGSQPQQQYVNGNYGAPPLQQVPQQHVPQQVPAITPQQEQRLQERLGLLNDDQANEVIKILDVKPNQDGDFEILIENMPPETIRVLENYLISVTGPF